MHLESVGIKVNIASLLFGGWCQTGYIYGGEAERREQFLNLINLKENPFVIPQKTGKSSCQFIRKVHEGSMDKILITIFFTVTSPFSGEQCLLTPIYLWRAIVNTTGAKKGGWYCFHYRTWKGNPRQRNEGITVKSV